MQERFAQHWIHGEWTGDRNGPARENRNPANGEPLGYVADADVDEVQAAIDSAHSAFYGSGWRRQPRLRATVLLRFARNVERNRDALAELLTLENGKPLAASRAEVAACVSELEFYAGTARTLSGRVIEADARLQSLVYREPAGVAALIIPWNAPGILLVRSLAPAMAAGCTVVIKGAHQTALFTSALMRCLADVPELPAGAVNLFSESGNEGARLLVQSTAVDVLAYTGSTAVGRQIMVDAAPTLKRLCLELGGKAPCVVFGDVDVTRTACALAAAGTILAGQQCTAASRIVAHRSIAEPLRDALADALRRIVVGSGLDPRSEMGPLIDQRNCERVLRLCELAGQGGDVILPVRQGEGALQSGSFLLPGLVAVQNLDAPGADVEVFGPMLNLEVFDEEEEAVSRANHHRYGLAASVWSGDPLRGMRVARQIRSGTVWLNTHNVLMPEVETGGVRNSGFGRQHGLEGLDLFLDTRHLCSEATA